MSLRVDLCLNFLQKFRFAEDVKSCMKRSNKIEYWKFLQSIPTRKKTRELEKLYKQLSKTKMMWYSQNMLECIVFVCVCIIIIILFLK